MGFSLVAIFELLYHFFKFFYMACKRIIDRNNANNKAKILAWFTLLTLAVGWPAYGRGYHSQRSGRSYSDIARVIRC